MRSLLRNIFKSSNKSSFYKLFYNFLYIHFFHICKNVWKLLAKYYQENKERLKKSLWKISKSFGRRKRRNDNIVANVTKISQRMINKSFLSIEKVLSNEKKCFIIIIRKYFNLENLKSIRNSHNKQKMLIFLFSLLCKFSL